MWQVGMCLKYVFRKMRVMLEHVIVTALGLEKDEATLAYSVQKIKGEELNRVKEVNMIAARQEKLPVCKSTKLFRYGWFRKS